jgi:hypothetical protein
VLRRPQRRSHAGRHVEVRELLDGRLVVLAEGARLATAEAPTGEFVLKPRRAAGAERLRLPRTLAHPPRLPRTLPRLAAPTHTGRRPLATHPWLRGYDSPRMLAKRPPPTAQG